MKDAVKDAQKQRAELSHFARLPALERITKGTVPGGDCLQGDML